MSKRSAQHEIKDYSSSQNPNDIRGFRSYLQSLYYNPYQIFAPNNRKRSYDDTYLESVGYDPYMGWKKRFDDMYMQSTGYDPSMGWANKRYDDSYMQSMSYDPSMSWVKRNYDDPASYMQSVGYAPGMGFKKKNYYDSNYPAVFLEGMKKSVHQIPSQNLPKDLERIHNQKRSVSPFSKYDDFDDDKRSPSGMGPRGFHEGIFNNNFGYFSPVKRNKRSPEAKNTRLPLEESEKLIDTIKSSQKDRQIQKRKFGMGSSGFYGDTFNEGFGGFSTMKKRRPEMDSSGFYGDVFSGGFGDFGTMKKRRPEMTSSGFYGDTFSHGFGDFGTMRKRRPEMTSSGFHGDIFSGGFGDFGTMKKRHPEMTSSGFYGDTFDGGFGDFYTMKRTPEMTSSGFYGDTFSGGFGDFSPMKRTGPPLPERDGHSPHSQEEHHSNSANIANARPKRDTEEEGLEDNVIQNYYTPQKASKIINEPNVLYTQNSESTR